MTYDLSTTEQGRKAEPIKETLRWQIGNIRADKKLTEDGKRQQVAAVYLQAKTQLSALKADEAQKRTSKIDSLRRTLFGTTGTTDAQTAISYRDAQERVAALSYADSDKAAKLLDQAQLSGDEVMVKALIQRSIDMQWVDVANKYIEKHPYYGEKLEELWNLDNSSSEGIDTVGFINSLVFHAEKPSELSNYFDDAQIADAANGARRRGLRWADLKRLFSVVGVRLEALCFNHSTHEVPPGARQQEVNGRFQVGFNPSRIRILNNSQFIVQQVLVQQRHARMDAITERRNVH